MRLKERKHTFLSDIVVAFASLDLKVPNKHLQRPIFLGGHKNIADYILLIHIQMIM